MPGLPSVSSSRPNWPRHASTCRRRTRRGSTVGWTRRGSREGKRPWPLLGHAQRTMRRGGSRCWSRRCTSVPTRRRCDGTRPRPLSAWASLRRPSGSTPRSRPHRRRHRVRRPPPTPRRRPARPSRRRPAATPFSRMVTSRPVRVYTEALDLATSAVFYANRAAAQQQLKRYEAAAEDCTKALALHRGYRKAMRRRAACLTELKRHEAALKDYDALCALDPEDAELCQLQEEASKAVAAEGCYTGG
mmetsp:Transcript_100944/g.174371  ORF Transcript_100944/g.174371 Transcript_100944/m.174371 type:complete len:246 (+) Transcript_100944:633-1370(+)